MFYEAKDVIPSDLLKRAYGEEVVLFEDDKESVVYQVLREFRLGEQVYAILHSPKLPKHVDYVLYRVVNNALGEVNLESIDDDEEWEAVAEVYDELTFMF